MARARLLSIVLVVICACGERPQRIGPGIEKMGVEKTGHIETGRSEKGLIGKNEAPTPSAADKTARFKGKVVLEGDLAGVQSGAVFVSARRRGQRLPSLSRKYEISDPAWSTQAGDRVLWFLLTDQDNMGGFGAPLGAEMEVEARYDPTGFIDPRPGSNEEGVVKAAVPASPGDSQLAITLQFARAK